MKSIVDLIIVIFVILLIAMALSPAQKKEGFGVEKRPFNYGNEYSMVNPFDEMDYITPAFYRY